MAPVSSEPSVILHDLEQRTLLGLNAAACARQWWAERPGLRLIFPEGPSSMVERVVRFWQAKRNDLLAKEEEAASLREENGRLRAELDAWDRRRSQGGDVVEMALDAWDVGVRLSSGEVFEVLEAWRSE